MRSFFLFIIRNYAVFLFILFELISFWLIFSFNSFHNTWFFNSANKVTGNVLNTYGSLTTYFTLSEVNDSLMLENAKLRSQLNHTRLFDTTSTITVRDTSGLRLYTYIPAEIISNSFTEPNNYLTLNKGTLEGINKNMGVITSNGIVGRVVAASENFSVIMSVLHSKFSSRVAVKRNNAQGRVVWDGKVPTHVRVIEVSEPGQLLLGDTIITTPASPLYPPDILVGTLQEYGKDEGSNFYTLDVKLSTNFGNLRYVYVVNNILKAERDSLEIQTIDAGN